MYANSGGPPPSRSTRPPRSASPPVNPHFLHLNGALIKGPNLFRQPN